MIQTFICYKCDLKMHISDMEDPEFDGEPIVVCGNCISEEIT